jgi:lincosamide nucleotidyltransferase A/C/D/E
MTADDAIKLYQELRGRGIDVWIDGGWAVDALLGTQTRPHSDLDIVLQQKDVSVVRDLLVARGFSDAPRDDTSSWNFVLAHSAGQQVDVHVIVFDGHGDGRYGPVERGLTYPAASLTGRGMIGDQPVRCISAEYLVRWHTGYELAEKDFQDVLALCDRFTLDVPPDYRAGKRRHLVRDI